MVAWLSAIGGIVFVDLVLSADNALVIGVAASRLPSRQRWMAIVLGGLCAIALRILFASLATVLFKLPFLGVIGGVILMIIAVRLLLDRCHDASKQDGTHNDQVSSTTRSETQGKLFSAVLTIIVADVTMSLDNVLAVGALSSGNLLVLAVGLLLSILLLLVSSAVIAGLIKRLPWLLDVACIVLAWTAANLLLSDAIMYPLRGLIPWLPYLVPIIAIAFIIAADLLICRHDGCNRWV